MRSAEWGHIVKSWGKRRQAAGQVQLSPQDLEELTTIERRSLRGLALSGGGIRSAAFSIGALQALHKGYALSRIHYLSTVSGGGYAGSALTWLFNAKHGEPSSYNTAANFPFDMAVQGGGGASLSDTLRYKASYLEPSVELGKVALAALVLRSISISVLAYFLFLTMLIYLVTPWLIAGQWHCPILGRAFPEGSAGYGAAKYFVSWPPAASIAAVAITAIVIWYLLSNISGAVRLRTHDMRRRAESYLPLLYSLAIGCFGLAALPFLYEGATALIADTGWLGAFGKTFATLGSIAAVMGSLLSHVILRNASASERNVLAGALLWVSGLVLIVILVLAAFAAAMWLGAGRDWQLDTLFALTVVAGLVGGLSNLNYTGLHRFYRDRLMEAFLPNPECPDNRNPQGVDSMAQKTLADAFPLAHACAEGSSGPYHLINCNVVLTSSAVSKYFSRGGDSFLLSPLYCGSAATGWEKTSTWLTGDKGASPWPWRIFNLVGLQVMRPITLATAMAISGAAVNPRTKGEGLARSGLWSFVSTLFNIRLGYWVPNPGAPASILRPGQKWTAWYPPNFLHPGVLGGLFAKRKNEKARWIELTDGGHFDNIGLYELVRRRVKNIIIIDGTADPDLKLESFANAYERVRNDFGVTIDISSYPANFNDMMPNTARPGSAVKTERHLAERGWAVGTIVYPGDSEPGFVFYVNTVLTERLPANLYSYHSAHDDFPDEPTSDQYFEEQQFEAYRELGKELTWDMLRSVGLYKDLAHAVGLVPTAGELMLDSSKAAIVESQDVRDDFARLFPKLTLMSIPTYAPKPDVLDWPP